MRALLDTHAFLWWLGDSERLSVPARSVMADEANAILVSAASAWEIATKVRLGKLAVREAVALDLAGAVASQGFEELAISLADAERAGRLPGPHRDPFDRMLIAQAQVEGLVLVTSDHKIQRYAVETLVASR